MVRDCLHRWAVFCFACECCRWRDMRRLEYIQRYLSQDALDRLGIGWKGRIWFLCDGVTFWAMSLRNSHNWDILILKRCASYFTDRQSFARFWEVEIQQRALLKTWKDPFSSLFVANNKTWLEETSLIVEVEEETTSEQGRVLDLVPRGRRDQMLTSKELWSARSCLSWSPRRFYLTQSLWGSSFGGLCSCCVTDNWIFWVSTLVGFSGTASCLSSNVITHILPLSFFCIVWRLRTADKGASHQLFALLFVDLSFDPPCLACLLLFYFGCGQNEEEIKDGPQRRRELIRCRKRLRGERRGQSKEICGEWDTKYY